MFLQILNRVCHSRYSSTCWILEVWYSLVREMRGSRAVVRLGTGVVWCWAEKGSWAMDRVGGRPQGDCSGALGLIGALRGLRVSTLLSHCGSEKNKGVK